jgi:hypothetical protein
MMADKKIARSRRERSLTPREKLVSALSDSGTISMAEPTHDKGKSALVDRFRKREERWRQEQALRDQEAGQEAEAIRRTAEEREQLAEQEGTGGGGER